MKIMVSFWWSRYFFNDLGPLFDIRGLFIISVVVFKYMGAFMIDVLAPFSRPDDFFIKIKAEIFFTFSRTHFIFSSVFSHFRFRWGLSFKNLKTPSTFAEHFFRDRRLLSDQDRTQNQEKIKKKPLKTLPHLNYSVTPL